MNKGVILFANNNEQVDYIRQAIFCAEQIKKHLKLPISLITNSQEHLENHYPSKVSLFDKVITIEKKYSGQRKSFRDGPGPAKRLEWNNFNRSDVYELTPYDETIVMDTDYIVTNDSLNNCFQLDDDFMIWKDSFYINPHGKVWEIRYVSDTSIKMYWATVFYFKKSKKIKTLFDTIRHIKQNWNSYRWIYQIGSKNFRNDFAFSIAIHMMNGLDTDTNWPTPLPGTLYYIFDRDNIVNFENDKFTFLCTNPKNENKQTVATVKGLNVHVMNKLGLQNLIEAKAI